MPVFLELSESTAPFDSKGTMFLAAVREQLGLKLVKDKGAIRTLVIDHVGRPSEN